MNTRMQSSGVADQAGRGVVLLVGLMLLASAFYLGGCSGGSGWRDLAGPPRVIDASQHDQQYAQPGQYSNTAGYDPNRGYAAGGYSGQPMPVQPGYGGGQYGSGAGQQQPYYNNNPNANPNAYGMSSAQPAYPPQPQQGMASQGYAMPSSTDGRMSYNNGGNMPAGQGYDNRSNGGAQVVRVDPVNQNRMNYQAQPNGQAGMMDRQSSSNPSMNSGYTVESGRGLSPQVSGVRVSEMASGQPVSEQQSPPLRSSMSAGSVPGNLAGQNQAGFTNSQPYSALTDQNLTDDPVGTIQPVPSELLGQTQPAVKISSVSSTEPLQPVSSSPAAAPSDVSLSSFPQTSVQLNDIMLMLEQYIERDPQNVDAQLALRFLYQAYGLDEKATGPMSHVPMDRQADALRLARTVLLAQQATSRTNRDNPEKARQAMEALEQLQEQVAAHADLEVANMHICKSAARGFGQYTELEKDLLSSGQPQTVWVYFELQNFRVQQDPAGKFSSKISADITLYDEQYRMVQQLLKAEVPDESYNRRRDFYLHAGPLKLPSLTPGRYQVVVSVEDKIAGKAARPARYEFEVKPNYQQPQK